MPALGRAAVRISWDAAYAGAAPVTRYDVLRNGTVIGSVDHRPQYSAERFHFDDVFDGEPDEGPFAYSVKAVDSQGREAESGTVSAAPL